MGLWVQAKPPFWWPFGAGEWGYWPGQPGNDNPNLPPPAVKNAVRGPAYPSADGHTYRTWIFPPSFYQHVDYREKLDVTKGDPASFELTPGQ